MNLATIFKLLHVFTAIWMIVGIAGRQIVLGKAGQSRDIREISIMLPIMAVFEKRMVIPGSLAVMIAGLITAWVQGWPILGFIQGGRSNWVLVSLLLFLSIQPVIFLVFIPRGKLFEKAFQDAIARDAVTPELSAAFHDPAVRAGHIYELAVIGVIVSLMVLKPF